jgi:hypothetical protein
MTTSHYIKPSREAAITGLRLVEEKLAERKAVLAAADRALTSGGIDDK